jgi:enterochelin esterase-like enzyme
MTFRSTLVALAAAWTALALPAGAHAQCPALPGTQNQTLMSMYMGGPEPFVVYLPPDYATSTRRYPVVYWFHGRGDNQCTQLPLAKNIQDAITRGAAAPMIYVFINGGSGCNFNDTTCPGKQVESYVMKELIPHIDATYRTVVGPGGRSLEGFSMGAEAVLRYFNKYADQFCDAVAYAPIGGAPLTAATQGIVRAKPTVALRVVVGTADGVHLPGCRSFEKMLMGINLPHEYQEVPGLAHNPFGLWGAMGGMVGLGGLAMHGRCFAGASSGSDGGAPPAPQDATAVPPAPTRAPDALTPPPDAAVVVAGPADAATVTTSDDGAAVGAGTARPGATGCAYAGGGSSPWLLLALLVAARRGAAHRRP